MEASSSANLSSNPLWGLPADDPRCINSSCLAYLYGWLEDQDNYNNAWFPLYAEWATYFYCVTVFIFTVGYGARRLSDGGRGRRLQELVLASWRRVMYRRVSGWLGKQVDLSYGQLAILIPATIFIFVLPFCQGYFFRELFRYGSPPLSVRCAMLISALLPICMALAGKVNIITLLTGISYAKLNVFHRYVAYVIWVLTIIHLVPHFMAPVREGGTEELRELLADKRRELSGIVLEFTFTLIVLSSIPWVRNRCYELFKVLHIFLAICFFVFLWWHIDGEAVSPVYFWVGAGVLLANFAARAIYRNRVPISFREFTKGFQTSLQVLPGNMTRVVVQCPQALLWKPGQHCYISMPGISWLQSHPFTIVSLSHHHSATGPNDLVLLIRACKGFTKLLSDLACKSESRSGSVSTATSWSDLTLANEDVQVSTRSWVDGPYGDFHPALELQYQGIICIAGGSGITSALPWLVYISSKMRQGANGKRGFRGEKLCKTKTLNLVWSVRHLSWIRWAAQEMSEALRDVMLANTLPARRDKMDETPQSPLPTPGFSSGNFKLKISIYVTQAVEDFEMKAALLDLYLGAGVDVYNPHAKVEVLRGRPDYATILPNMIDRKKNVIMTCGPQSQKSAVANSVASMQSLVINNQSSDISLHSETFGW